MLHRDLCCLPQRLGFPNPSGSLGQCPISLYNNWVSLQWSLLPLYHFLHCLLSCRMTKLAYSLCRLGQLSRGSENLLPAHGLAVEWIDVVLLDYFPSPGIRQAFQKPSALCKAVKLIP